MSKASSKRWNTLVGNYKREKNVTASPGQILSSLDLLHDYMKETGKSSDITEHMKNWVGKKTGSSPVTAYDDVIHGVRFNNWLNEKA